MVPPGAATTPSKARTHRRAGNKASQEAQPAQQEQQGSSAGEQHVGEHAAPHHSEPTVAAQEHPQQASSDPGTEEGVDTGSGPELLTEDLLDTEDMLEGGQGASQSKAKRKKVLGEEKLKRIKEDHEKRGVVYVSRIPPHMKPSKLKQLLSEYGEILRVYCTPEDPHARKIRKQKGGNTGRNFTEGWIEFTDKRIAKRTALMLNGTQIGGKRRSAYYEDLWCLKYLRKFKWDHLTEEIAYQKAVREQRLAAEIRAAKKERDHYLAQVDKAKAQAAMAERRAAKQQKLAADAPAPEQPSHSNAQPADGSGGGSRLRFFGQRQPKPDPAAAQPADGARVLSDDVLMMVARKKQRVS